MKDFLINSNCSSSTTCFLKGSWLFINIFKSMGLFENQMKSTGSKNTDKNVSLKVCIQFSGVSEPYTGFTDP